ncbi:Lipoprotein-anchoring transpeptidase ErfK/SrfK [Bradyrhizobium lablabi]|uniref:Lipoprotein-anchoring transpeptidase ErfK/SrfK n=1 Tax=Bradyrhizobium lablabi TaxID=722472 RepID=A0A1M6IGK7_9BRAD|nr:L,D-transpeptidase family protein [Bradyrhizobium lablabi]SHJ33564.1 Lipoprotein-anchoring transpeptidase ErfK/SrfK [Bradyrhizobium lablabi]
MMRVRGHGVLGGTKRFWRIAALSAAGAIGAASQAEAALYYWSDYDPGYYRPAPMAPQRRPKLRPQQAKKPAVPEKESAKPQGPVIIAISIDQQKLRLYDANGFFAESPISTGMKGHPTPMGVFSVIQKQKLHHSNIYSGAPMPYMQRITWSGVAIHAGVLPGYPASHGCIRMPMAFAIKMWNWTKMGARVVVVPGELTPSNFSHPLLATRKVVPQPVAASEPQADAPAAAKGDKAADAAAIKPAIEPTIKEASLELRSTVGHHDSAKPAIDEPSASTPLRDQTHTADASGEMSARNSVTMSDAAPSGGSTPTHDEASAANDSALPAAADTAKAGGASNMEANSETGASTAKHDEIASPDDKPAATKSAEALAEEIESPETGAPNDATKTADHAQTSADAVKAEAKAEATKREAKADDIKTEPQKADPPKSNEKPDASVKAVSDAGAGVPAKKDQNRLTDAEKPAAAKPDPAAVLALKRPGQIAVFVSRKDSKLYVRQNFSPLFEMPIAIAPSDRPLGTHIFTAQVDKDDANVLHWSVVSLPAPARHVERRDEDDRASRRRKVAGAVEMKPMPKPDSPAEALDRLGIPAETMARITEALSTGSSIIVSDQGIAAGETGEGTDFIVSLR